MNARAATPESWTTWRFRERSAFIGVLEGRVASAGASPRLPLAIRRGTQGDASRKGILRTFRPSKNHSTKIKRSRTRLQLVLRANWCWRFSVPYEPLTRPKRRLLGKRNFCLSALCGAITRPIGVSGGRQNRKHTGALKPVSAPGDRQRVKSESL
jgi:hypothetical protein